MKQILTLTAFLVFLFSGISFVTVQFSDNSTITKKVVIE